MKINENILPENEKDKIAYLYRLQEKLRLYHNIKAQDYADGEITLEEFRTFQKEWFEPRNYFICELLNECKENLKNDNNISANVSDIEE